MTSDADSKRKDARKTARKAKAVPGQRQGVIGFLKTKRSEDELRIALDVLREFKAHESVDEWIAIMFSAWAKLEQLEEYLDHLVNGEPLREDTLAFLAEGSEAP